MLSVSHWLERRAVFYWWCCNLQYVPFVKFLCVSFSSRILVSHVGCCEVIVLNIKHIQVSRGLLRGVRIWISSLSWNQLPRLFSIEVDKNRVHKWFTIKFSAIDCLCALEMVMMLHLFIQPALNQMQSRASVQRRAPNNQYTVDYVYNAPENPMHYNLQFIIFISFFFSYPRPSNISATS